MKQWFNTPAQAYEGYKQIAEDMRADGKPRSLDVKIPVNKRSLEHNALLHLVIRQVRKHLFDHGKGFYSYEDEATGRMVRMPLDDETVKNYIKKCLGVKVEIMDIILAKPTREYSPTQMWRLLGFIDEWAATDLNFQIVYKKKLEAIEEKYRDES